MSSFIFISKCFHDQKVWLLKFWPLDISHMLIAIDIISLNIVHIHLRSILSFSLILLLYQSVLTFSRDLWIEKVIPG